MSKAHAEHNEKLGLVIDALNNYDDWVVTTAFYACIHFVEYKLFPLTENGTTYHTFNKYYNDIILAGGKRTSKHNVKLSLVKSYLPAVGANYKRLMDNCFTARYNNYLVGKTLSQIAVSDMGYIKSACI
jgi:hypothetical protein